MMDQIFRSQRVRRRLRRSILGAATFDEFVVYLVERGHPATTIQQYVQGVEHFDAWLRRGGHAVASVTLSLVDTFLTRHLPRCQCPPPSCTTVPTLRTALRHLIVILRRSGRVEPTVDEGTVADQLMTGYAAHLSDVRGVAPATCSRSVWYAREFLAGFWKGDLASLSKLRASAVTSFFSTHAERWSPATMKVAATSLRRFFRYLQLIGLADDHLIHTVPKIAHWALATIPRVLTDQEISRLLSSFDRATPTGLRGYASTMCLVGLGLRTGEVSALTLDDIDWQAGTIAIAAAKTRKADVLPLPARVARAILAYMRRGRPTITTQRIFVCHSTPVGRPGRPGIVRAAVREASVRAGFAAPGVGPNMLRHTFATRLLRSGATMKDVADILRHRSLDTTTIYAKVDVDQLRKVAGIWPGSTR